MGCLCQNQTPFMAVDLPTLGRISLLSGSHDFFNGHSSRGVTLVKSGHFPSRMPLTGIIGLFFLTVVKCLYNYLRDLGVKAAVAAVYQNGYKKRHPSSHGGGGPATMYTPEPHHWDHPVPVWAMRPPPSVWDPDYLQQLDPRYALEGHQALRPPSRPVRTSSSLRSKPTQVLPDGTIVVPIGSEDDDDIVEPVTDQDHSEYGSVRTLSDKYQKPVDAIDDGLISHVSSLPTVSGSKAISEDRSSIVSLSDKYRQQEEVEIFHEHYQKPPPEPVRPKKASLSSESTQSSKT